MSYQIPNLPDMEYLDRQKRSFVVQLYYREIARGVWITSKHFFRNLWKWLTFRKGGCVILYPEETRGILLSYPHFQERYQLIDLYLP